MNVAKRRNHPGIPFLRQVEQGAGFTLIELVVTLVIIGAIAATAIPAFFNVQTFQQSGFYNETLASVRYAQKLAVASGCAVQVQISASNYTLSQVPPGAFSPSDMTTCNTPPYSDAITDPSNLATTYTRSAPNGVALSPVTFVFCPLGNVADGVVACPSLSTQPNIAMTVGSDTITVVRATGRVCNATASC